MQPKRILVIRTDRIGDVVLTTPALKALRLAFPQAHLAVLITPATQDLIKGNPYVDEIILDDRKGVYKGVLGFLQLARRIRSGNFDLAVIYHTKRRYNLACFLAGVTVRLGYKNNKGGCFLNLPVDDMRPKGIKHEAMYCLDLLNAIGVYSKDMSLFVAHQYDADQWANQWVMENIPENFSLIAIHPGSSDLTRCWSTDNFASLINQIANRYFVKIVFIGAINNRPLVDAIKVHLKNGCLDLTGQTSIAQTVALFRRTKLLISTDSGPVHVAAAVGCNNICIFLRDIPGLNYERWYPLGDHSITVRSKLKNQDLSVSVDEVLTAVDDVMRRENQSTFVW